MRRRPIPSLGDPKLGVVAVSAAYLAGDRVGIVGCHEAVDGVSAFAAAFRGKAVHRQAEAGQLMHWAGEDRGTLSAGAGRHWQPLRWDSKG